MQNKDILNNKVIKDFGSEWKNFDQSKLTENELINNFNQYFSVFPLHELDKKKEGFDLGCGSGRWAKLIAPRVKKLNCIEPSLEAIKVAKKQLGNAITVKVVEEIAANMISYYDKNMPDLRSDISKKSGRKDPQLSFL